MNDAERSRARRRRVRRRPRSAQTRRTEGSFMYQLLGAREVNAGRVTFRLFFPDRAIDANQYVGGGLPNVRAVRVVGDFQAALGGTNWDAASAPVLLRSPALDDAANPCGWEFSVESA